MSGVMHDYMEQYLRQLIPDREGILKELEEYAEKNAVPIIQKESGKFLELMVSITKPKRILELGTAIGYSSIMMAEALDGNVHIDTIERDENMIEQAKKNIEKYGFKDNITVLSGDCLEVLQSLNGKYDFIFMDAGKGHYNHFHPHCMSLLSDDGIIVADNVLFRGMVASKDLVKRRKITIVKRMKSYLEMVSEDDNLITSVIPMGDGISVTKRRKN
ncbi:MULTISPECIES: O-methyltransferase [Clostridium]|uniref:tRNA 5-hydroxyuridine methyltransferase n=1 Tax=Clostridium cadaveris TaxID=1529 RepID=A0A1I2JAM8_9CLOT|nr:O-methyltransferase [Clostridium cadaveris]MDU4951981.1 O-methyltransferase [Clostridium sp.]MDM8311830.1 O-methyltransferase [Clostridium cadaveris]MDY4950343.1 O-methyltransferase [Clostridium cadaveris]NME65864.1 O-methyltransferase [Clostridium cadaveris]PWL53034.1 MAG: O-methyltransferase [Clostridium cadaveris]